MIDYDDPNLRKSYLKINYNLRPAKSAERKMFCEAFRNLSFFNKLENYRYVGFGSTYFNDFALFHRSLGINKMISIEKHIDDKERFEFNKPYKCIDLKFGNSNEILPSLSWDESTILWLDYDNEISSTCFEDIGIFCSKAISGSVIIVTVNVTPEKNFNQNESITKKRFNKLIKQVGKDRIPIGITEKDCTNKNYAKIIRKILLNEVLDVLEKRNGGYEKILKIQFKQLFNFLYEDGARMLSFGGLLISSDNVPVFENCEFQNLDYYKPSEEPFFIEIPNLTFREIRFLDKKLPHRDEEGEIKPLSITDLGDLACIPINDIENYTKIYRYYPNFIESEI